MKKGWLYWALFVYLVSIFSAQADAENLSAIKSAATNALQGKVGLVMVSNLKTGQILLVRDPYNLINKKYSAASTARIVTAFGAFSEGLNRLGKTAADNLAESNDAYLTELGRQLGAAKLGRYLQSFGLAGKNFYHYQISDSELRRLSVGESDRLKISPLDYLRFCEYFCGGGTLYDYSSKLDVTGKKSFQIGVELINLIKENQFDVAEDNQIKNSRFAMRSGCFPEENPTLLYVVLVEGRNGFEGAKYVAKKLSGAFYQGQFDASHLVRVGLFYAVDPANIIVRSFKKTKLVNQDNDQLFAVVNPGVEFTLQAFKGKVRVTAGGKKYLVRKLWFPGEAIFSGPGIPPAQYRGEFEVTNLYGRLQIVNVLPMEGYLKNVIPAEMTPSFPKEALKAQAVAARTYAYQHLGKHGRQGFDFCDTTHCQVYLGIRKEDSRTAAIVEETAGMVLTYKGRLINAIYQSDCAGKTSNNETIFGGVSLTYLRGVDDKDYCKYSPYSKPWKVHFTKEELLKALKKDSRTNPGNNLNNIEVQKTDWAGRPITVKISGDNTKIVSGYYFWLIVGRTLSWSDFISTMYEIKKSGDGYEINGKGNGHGIGMCQWGAVGMAQRGFTYDKILEHYYPGTKLENAEKMNF